MFYFLFLASVLTSFPCINNFSNKYDDWISGDGTVLNFPSTSKVSRFQSAYDYCVKHWCIKDEDESLFEYNQTQGESFQQYSKCKDRYEKDLETCVENPSQELEAICGTNEACLTDACSGDLEDGEASLVVEDTFVETKCAKEAYFEDFEGSFDTEAWGQAAKTGGARYIGPLGKSNPVVQNTFEVPEEADSLTVEFVLFEFDEWDADAKVLVTVGDVELDLLSFAGRNSVENPNNEQNGKFGGVSWTRFSVSEAKDAGMGGGEDQAHKISIRVPPNQFKDGELAFQLELEMSTSIDKASGGLDNFRIVAHMPCKGDPENRDLEDERLSLPRMCSGMKVC